MVVVAGGPTRAASAGFFPAHVENPFGSLFGTSEFQPEPT